MTDIRYDAIQIKATLSESGHLRDSPVLSRVGIFGYRDPSRPGGTRKEFRPPEEVFKQAHLDSLLGAPVIDGHPRGLAIDRADHKTVGNDGKPWQTIGSAISIGRQDGDNMTGDVVVHHPGPVLNGKKHLSLGYRLRIDETPGEYNGERYDVVQRDLIVDHIACVKTGRAGNARFNLDASDLEDENTEGNKMADTKLVAVRLDSGIEYQASPEVAHALEKTTSALKEAQAEVSKEKSRADTAEAARDDLKAKVDKFDGAKADMLADARKQVEARVRLDEMAKSHGVEVRADMSDLDLRKSVINKLSPTIRLDGKSNDYIDAMFDVVSADASKKNTNAGSQRQQVEGRGVRYDENNGADKTGSASAARGRMIANASGKKE